MQIKVFTDGSALLNCYHGEYVLVPGEWDQLKSVIKNPPPLYCIKCGNNKKVRITVKSSLSDRIIPAWISCPLCGEKKDETA